MNTTDADATQPDWADSLAALLNDLADVQAELLEVLEQKRPLMAARDVEGMNQLQHREQQLCDRLEACQQRRAMLLEQASQHGLPSKSLGRLAGAVSAGETGGLAKRVKDSSARMRVLRHHSLANWVLAQRTLLHLSQMLEIIARGGQIQPTYGRERHPAARGALVDREA